MALQPPKVKPGQRLPEWNPNSRVSNIPQRGRNQTQGGRSPMPEVGGNMPRPGFPNDPSQGHEPGGFTGGRDVPQIPGGPVGGQTPPVPPGGPGGGNQFSGPSSDQFRQLFQTLLGPSQHNSFGGQVNADMYAQEHGMDPNQVHQQMNASRNYAGQHEQLMKYLMSKGYSLEDMGFQDRPEMGKHEFDMDRAGFGTMGQGLDTGYQYDWNNGTKRYAISSDPNAINRVEQISPQEMAIHQRGQNLAGQGFDTRAKQLYANSMAQAGRQADPNHIQHGRLNLDVLAKRFGIDRNALSGFDQFNVLQQPPGQARNVSGIPQPGYKAPGPNSGGSTPVTQAIQGGGSSAPQAPMPPQVQSQPQSAPQFGMPSPSANLPMNNGMQSPPGMPSFQGGGVGGAPKAGRNSILGLGNQGKSGSFGGGGSQMGGGGF